MEGALTNRALAETTAENFILQIDLQPLTLKTDRIWRKISIPANSTFSQLHVAIQIVFEWDDIHLWNFTVRDCTKWTSARQSNAAAELLELTDERLRKVVKHEDEEDEGRHPFWEPHWEDNWEPFRSQRPRRPPPQRKARTTSLLSVLEDEAFKGKKIKYEWDGWEHIITVKGRFAFTEEVQLISAKNHVPEEDWPFVVDEFEPADKVRVKLKLAECWSKGIIPPGRPVENDDDDEGETSDNGSGEDDADGADEGEPEVDGRDTPGDNNGHAVALETRPAESSAALNELRLPNGRVQKTVHSTDRPQKRVRSENEDENATGHKSTRVKTS